MEKQAQEVQKEKVQEDPHQQLGKDIVEHVVRRATPIKGVHYRDGKDGRDGRHGLDGKDGKSIKGQKGDKGDKGDPGKDGKDASTSHDEVVKAVISKLKNGKDEEKLDISHLKNSAELRGMIGKMRKIDGDGFYYEGTKYYFSDLMHGGGSSSGTSQGTFRDNEIPTGAINNANTAFTLAHVPIASSEHVYVNGQRLAGGGVDYTLTGAALSLNNPVGTGGTILVDYRYS